MFTDTSHVVVTGATEVGFDRILTEDALAFVTAIEKRFGDRRTELLALRSDRQLGIDAGELPRFHPETAAVRAGDWTVVPPAPDLTERKVEITGPVDPKMIINALNSGASVFMADFEDSASPTWSTMINGQIALSKAVRGDLSFTNEQGKTYTLGTNPATLMVRPRGFHLVDDHILIHGKPISASFLDFGLYFFHNAAHLLANGSGPYFYLPKLESHLEARLWNDVFVFAQDALGIPQGSVRATVLIETILAAFEMDEILYELRDHSAGLNAGRWDYIFSVIKKFRNHPAKVLPDREQITMSVPFMSAYTDLLVQTCHRRGAHAMGGMAAFIPSRRDAEVNERAFTKVRADKAAEVAKGHDGTWVAHPDLIRGSSRSLQRHPGRGIAPNLSSGTAWSRQCRSVARLHNPRRGSDLGWSTHKRRRRHPVPCVLAHRERSRRYLQPDGGRCHSRDLTIPTLAVAAQRRDDRGRSSRRRTPHPIHRRGGAPTYRQSHW